MKIRLSDASKDLQKAAAIKYGYGVLQTGWVQKASNGWLVFVPAKGGAEFVGLISDDTQDQSSAISDTVIKEYRKRAA